MNREKVIVMTDEELRIKTAELLGYTEIKDRYLPVPWLMDLCENVLSGFLDSKLCVVKDYPNDIAAAWELEPRDRRREYGRALIEVLGFEFGEPISWESTMDLAWTCALDRTRAFVLAMERLQ